MPIMIACRHNVADDGYDGAYISTVEVGGSTSCHIWDEIARGCEEERGMGQGTVYGVISKSDLPRSGVNPYDDEEPNAIYSSMRQLGCPDDKLSSQKIGYLE
jgi:hypothetical protein